MNTETQFVPETTQYEITLNGERRSFTPGTTLLDLVRSLGLVPDRLAIELNRSIVKRDNWAAVQIDSDAEVEIVQFVGGG